MLGDFVAAQKLSTLVRDASALARPWLVFDRTAFDSAYNRRPFALTHRLAEHPLFQLEPLQQLCRRLPANQVKHRLGAVAPDTDFDTSLDHPPPALALHDALDGIEERSAYIVVNNPERDAAYRPVIEGLLGEIAAQTARVDRRINWYSTYVFISTEGSVTPYHMDREMNFLLQVRGHKTARLWDPQDDAVMTSEQKDVLLTDRDARRPAYSPALDAKAMVFDLQPGIGIHHPFIAPHLVTTGAALSISLAITFRTDRSDMWTDAHAFNWQLRQLGLHPGPVRRNEAVDMAKAAAIRLLRRGRASARAAAAVWRPRSRPR